MLSQARTPGTISGRAEPGGSVGSAVRTDRALLSQGRQRSPAESDWSGCCASTSSSTGSTCRTRVRKRRCMNPARCAVLPASTWSGNRCPTRARSSASVICFRSMAYRRDCAVTSQPPMATGDQSPFQTARKHQHFNSLPETSLTGADKEAPSSGVPGRHFTSSDLSPPSARHRRSKVTG